MTISKVFTEKKPITAKTIVDKALSFIGTYDGGNNNVLSIQIITEKKCLVKIIRGVRLSFGIYSICAKRKKLFCDGAKTAYCPYIHSLGQRSEQLVDKTKGEYGDIVLFDWNADGMSDHVGFILSRNGNGTYEKSRGQHSYLQLLQRRLCSQNDTLLQQHFCYYQTEI